MLTGASVLAGEMDDVDEALSWKLRGAVISVVNGLLDSVGEVGRLANESSGTVVTIVVVLPESGTDGEDSPHSSLYFGTALRFWLFGLLETECMSGSENCGVGEA